MHPFRPIHFIPLGFQLGPFGTGGYEGMPYVVQILYKLSGERPGGPWIRRLFRYQEWPDR
jgi:hypothetical protein